jgi:hypothetical protein
VATFILKIGKQQTEFDQLAPEELKESFRKLRDTIAEQLGEFRCVAHHREPTIFLQSEGERVRLSGFGTCCEEFARKVQEQIKLPKEFAGSTHVRLTRLTYKYKWKQR